MNVPHIPDQKLHIIPIPHGFPGMEQIFQSVFPVFCRSGIGGFVCFLQRGQSQQGIHGYTKKGTDVGQHGQIRGGGAVLPFADGLIRYVEDFTQFLLGEIMFFSKFCKFEFNHMDSPFCLMFPIT